MSKALLKVPLRRKVWPICQSLVLQVPPEPARQRKVNQKMKPVAANAVPDGLTTKLAQQTRRSYEKMK